jgi:hypothetical protein
LHGGYVVSYFALGEGKERREAKKGKKGRGGREGRGRKGKGGKGVFSTFILVRSRYITGFAEFIEGDPNKDIMELLELYYKRLVTDPHDPASIFSQLEALKQERDPSLFKQELCKLVRSYLMHNGTVRRPDPEDIDWMAGGICYIESVENAITYRIREVSIDYYIAYTHFTNQHQGIVIEAIQHYLAQNGHFLTAFLIRELLDRSIEDESGIGVMFDFLVSASIVEQSYDNKRPGFLEKIPWANNTFSFKIATKGLDLGDYLETRGDGKVRLFFL